MKRPRLPRAIPRALPIFSSPLVRRVLWHLGRMRGQLDRRFFLSLGQGIVGFVLIAAVLITLFEKPWTFESVFDSFNWGIATVLGQGDSAFVTSPAGRLIGWFLILFGVAMLGMITGALVAMVIDFLLKEGQGLGAAGYKDHIIVCGWNTTARDLIAELRGDDYQSKVVVLADLDKNPAGDGVYFVRGDATDDADLRRAGIEEAAAALVFPRDASDDADMHSILAIMAIEHAAPGVRTVAEVNNPRHEPHFRRANVDELLVTSKVASHLLARSALYPGLTGIITDIVSGGEGSELYRISLPDDYCGMTIDEVAGRLRREHHATLLSVNRGGHAFVNPGTDFRLEQGDDAVVVAESLGTLAPLRIADATVAPLTAAVVPSA
ncbi:MAG TPA: NAD-binding protein [Candidatus Limnocylindrales bacterium]|jgi:voltage-gated potassium channel|nr:NAD-binding protein [Candidatus Limnocylindrales bacterium]